MLRERPPRPFRQHRHLCAEVRAGLKVRLGLAILVEPLVFRPDARDAAALEKNLHSRKARKNVHARALHALRKPLRKLVQRDHVVAVIPQKRRIEGELPSARACEIEHPVARDGRIERRALGFEIGNEFPESARIEHRPRQAVRPDFGGFLEDVDAIGLKGRGGMPSDELDKTQRATQARRPRAHNQDAGLESFALGFGHGDGSLRAGRCGRRRGIPRPYFPRLAAS